MNILLKTATSQQQIRIPEDIVIIADICVSLSLTNFQGDKIQRWKIVVIV